MQVAPFSSIGVSITIAATTANSVTQLATIGSPTTSLVLRVVNEGSTPALIVMGNGTANATTSPYVMSVLPGERIFTWDPTATYVAVAMRSGSANVQIQLGTGV